MRDLLARRALEDVRKILTLQDRNPHSPTYGCFDRNFWHYRLVDFPSGMAQEFVWPLALAWALPLPDNPFRESKAVREWVEAGLAFAARSAHADGSCDDYYPYERAVGASAFSLLAALESYALLRLDDPALLAFFVRRGRWLARHRESGRLANHEALVTTCLVRLADLTGDARWQRDAEARLARLLAWQSPEGWFTEYDGCDPGYLTLTISLLARLDELRPDLGLREPLRRAIAFAAEFVHPDGSYGGEYGSRSTLNFFPHGFELVGRWWPAALAVNDGVLPGLGGERRPAYGDDHLIGHHAWNYLLAWRDFVPDRPGPAPRVEGRRYFPEAGLLIERRGGRELYLGLRKGGVFKLFRQGRLLSSDTQLSLQVRRGRRRRNAVAHLPGAYEVTLAPDRLEIAGAFAWASHAQMTPLRLVALRLLMLGVGRFVPDLVRRLLQRLLITGRRPAPLRFRRILEWAGDELRVTDEVTAGSWRGVEALGVGGHQTSIYVVMSRVFEQTQLQPWLDLTPTLAGLRDGEPLRLERRL